MITEEEISHQNNNFFDLSHPTGDHGAEGEAAEQGVREV